MNSPQRLLFDKRATASEKRLLQSWAGEQPSAGAREETLAMLGIGTASLGAAGTSLAPKAVTLWTTLAVTKWLVGALAAITVAGALCFRGSSGPAVMPPRPPVADQTQRTLPLSALALPSLAKATAPAVAPPPSNTERARSPRASVPQEGALTQQIAILDHARATLAAGDPIGAGELLNEYGVRFPNGSFVEEAEVLRIEGLLREGDRAAANRIGTRFLSAHPTSAHATRVRTLVDGAAP